MRRLKPRVELNTAPQPASNPWVVVPEVPADRCVAEAVGTAENPKTGALERVVIDPETGKRVCPAAPPKSPKPPR